MTTCWPLTDQLTNHLLATFWSFGVFFQILSIFLNFIGKKARIRFPGFPRFSSSNYCSTSLPGLAWLISWIRRFISETGGAQGLFLNWTFPTFASCRELSWISWLMSTGAGISPSFTQIKCKKFQERLWVVRVRPETFSMDGRSRKDSLNQIDWDNSWH